VEFMQAMRIERLSGTLPAGRMRLMPRGKSVPRGTPGEHRAGSITDAFYAFERSFAMACFEHGTIIDLAARESVPLQDVRGMTLRVTRGTVWITQENDTRDIVLRTGDNWVVEKDGLTLVEAQRDATLCALGREVGPQRTALPHLGRTSTRWQEIRAFALAQYMAPLRRTVPHV
jgi:hypothetical protein